MYSIVLVSGVWQSDSGIDIDSFFRIFPIIAYYKILNIVLFAIQ